MKKLIILFVGFGLGCLLVSCADQKKEKKFRVGFSQCTGGDLWRQTMLEEMNRELSFHSDLVFLYKDAAGNSQKQVQQIRELIDEKIDLLIVSPNEVRPLSPIIQKVYDSGIPVVVVDRRTNSQKYTAFVGAENFEVGQNAGRYAASLLKGKGNIIEVTGLPDASPVIDRHNGFVDIISHYPGLKYVKKIDDNSRPFAAVEERTLQADSNIDLIFAQNDFMGYDAYKICKKLGIDKKVKIIGIDGLAAPHAGLDMVANKYISGTVLYPTGGQEAILAAANILEGKPYNKENRLATTIIDSSNVRIMQEQSEKVASQQKEIEKRQIVIDRQIVISRNQSSIILLITLAFIAALLFGGISYYYGKENKKINSRLKKQNIEISEQKNQLVEMSAKAEVAHQAKLNFFTNISHEFRTPLTLILSPLEDLVGQPRLPAAARHTLQLVQKNVMRLYRLVNQLMDFRKIEFGKMRLRASENDLIAFIREIVGSYEVLARQKQIGLQLLTAERVLPVWFDVTMIDKVIFNLLSNAFKFTKENGYIHVFIDKDKEFAVVKIEDNGIGMTPEAIAHAFEPFFQGEYENYNGTGLGLALSKELIDLHRGSITVQSKRGKGTVFEIRLPLGDSHIDKAELIIREEGARPLREDERMYITELYENAGIEPEAEQGVVQKDYSLLIVEDNHDLRNYISSRLSASFDVMEAENADRALQLAFDTIPDLIVCDVVIPGKNGLEIAKIIKADVRTSHIPVILLTARSEDNQKIEGLRTGADAYITKPFHFQFLTQTIHSLLHNREKTRDHYSMEIPADLKSGVSKKGDRKFISEFSAIVENNIANDEFGVDQICSELNISRAQLYRKVKSAMECNVNEYITLARLQKAKYYLRHEELSISEIAFKTGFSSATYFSTAFRAKFSMTPSEYKENKRVSE